MTNLMIANSMEFGKISILVIDNKKYFSAVECAKTLGYSNPRDAVLRHCKKDGVVNHDVIDSMGRPQQVKFISEGNLYRLIVKSKLPTAEKFERWVFDEILPSIINKGSYSLEQKQEQPYEYFDKTFNGVPVLSVLDIVHFTGLSQTTINWYIRKSDLICGIDYFVAEGRALAEMKKRHPKMSAMIPRMLLITKSGFDKLMKENGVQVEQIPCFNTPIHKEKPKKLYAMVPQNETIQNKLQHIRSKMQALDELMVCYNRYNVEVEASKGFLSAIKSVGIDIMTGVFDLEEIKPKTTTEKVL